MSSIRIAAAAVVLVVALAASSWGAVRACPMHGENVIVTPTHPNPDSRFASAGDRDVPSPAQTPATRPTPGQLPPKELPRAPDQYVPSPPPPPPADTADSFMKTMERLRPIRVGGAIKQPAKIKDVKPMYPPDAQGANIQGVVIIETIIDTDGTVADARILRSIPMLDEAALNAVRQWRFTPTELNGDPTAIIMTVTVNFTLQ